MIITLTGADFSGNNINNAMGTRYTITFTCKDESGGALSPYSGNTSKLKEGNSITFNASNTPLVSGYEFVSASPASITNISADTSVTVTYKVKENSGSTTPTIYTFTINPTPSDAIVILTATGYTQDGNSISVPSGTSVSWTVSADGYTPQSGTQIISATTTKDVVLYDSSWITLPTTKKALGVTSSGTGRVSSNNAQRFSTADETKANGILIPAGKTMHLSGLASGTYPLRFDYIYCTGNVECPVSGSTTPIEGLVGTASNYVSSNYFPMNKDGADTADIVNNFGEDYYFWIGFAGLTLKEGILAAYDTYTLMYKID